MLAVYGATGLDERPLKAVFTNGFCNSMPIDQVGCNQIGAFNTSK